MKLSLSQHQALAAQFHAQEAAILAELPEEFRSAVSAKAYDAGHAYGYEEVLIHVRSLVNMLKPAIAAYDARKK